jgi:Protein of unknown function (DUF1585)
VSDAVREAGRTRGFTPVGLSVAWLTLGALACSGGGKATSVTPTPDADVGADATTEAPPAIPFVAVSPFTYVAKVKNILVGLPPTDDEVTQVAAKPADLKTLIQAWMKLPAYEEKMQRFFELAFQQTQVSAIDFADQTYPKQIGINATTTPLLVQNAQESFARTMIQLTSQGRPMTEGTTTQRFMMTTALKELYAFLDVWQVDDSGKVTDRFRQANPKLAITVGTASGPIAIVETLDPKSPNYMHWYNPDAAMEDAAIADCAQDPIPYPPSAATLHYLLYGSLDNRKSATGAACPQSGGSATTPQLTPSDFNDWTMVTVRQPKAAEIITAFYDLPTLRTAAELVLSIPRAGFFGTPAFFANWQTNISNQMRVTLNQTLIVALGSSIDGTDHTVTPGMPPPGLDTAHASAGACFLCHQTLDPLRSIFSATYSWNYHGQDDAALVGQKGMFSFRGVVQPVSTVSELGGVLGQHPLFAEAWAQKLCSYANSVACSSDDPEFQRIVAAFKASNYSWSTLVTELLASPITTGAADTKTWDDSGEIIAVSRRDHLCAALDNRLGLADVCGLDLVNKKQLRAAVPQIVSGMPSDGYGRGSTVPVLPNRPTLFYRAGIENLCGAVAGDVIDVPVAKQVPGARTWSSTQPDAAIADFVATIMALVPSDTRSAPATALLKGHFTAAMQQGATGSDALKSTFVTACLAPSAVAIGL